ncbi:MAG: hypothetical protein OEM15_10380 [Myxococcales bacterium]|nr:hypothetical protein [Myxococcales bacterium]MDH3482905.1 hypothetical protein [Myxococcales bacterium]
MRNSRHSVSLATVGLAFAVVLSPALFQTGDASCEGGDTTLSMLEFEVAGENLIIFDSQERLYDVLIPEGVDTATVRAESRDPAALVNFHSDFGDETPQEGLRQEALTGVGVGGGEVVYNMPPGESTLIVSVEAPQGAEAAYMIHVIRSTMCP